jgi:probable F420-dependent oxidoreductase
VKVDYQLDVAPGRVLQAARHVEDEGYDGVSLIEAAHDPFLAAALVASATSRAQVSTGIAVAFARSPMTLAVTANDLQLLSQGRFLLGLGSQVKAHITRRFSMPWSQPAARMRELVMATRAIWRTWNEGVPLEFEGEFYRHTLMTPMFNPGPNPHGAPGILLAGVGAAMTQVAGQVADGLLCHGFTTERYLREVTLPGVAAARASVGRSMDGFEVGGMPFVVTGADEREMAAVKQATKEQLAFYASTPAYRPVLDLHGWGELQTELTVMSKAGRWREMGDLVDDELLNTVAVVAEPSGVAAEIERRYGDLFTRAQLYVKGPLSDDVRRAVVAELRGLAPSAPR